MNRGARLAVPASLLVVLLISGCSAPPVAPITDLSRQSRTVEVLRIVRPGDTLYSMSWAAGVDYRQLAAWNGLSAPYIIRPGQRLSLVPTGAAPDADSAASAKPRVSALPAESDTRARAVAPVTASPAPAGEGGAKKQPAAAAAPTPVPESRPATPPAPAPAPEPVRRAAPGEWRWPVQGNVVGNFSQSRGMDIAVGSGTPVKASAAGRVVYAGSGLRGYGQLIIVKHSDEYLSAYGHNRKLLVQEGDSIVSGQVIAESGSAPGRGEQVHFEIRRNGKPVDPQELLPRRS